MSPRATRKPAEAPGDILLQGEIFELFYKLFGRLRDHYAETAASFGLTPQQAKTVRLIGEPRSMREIADELQIDASYVTSLADQLEEAGLVERRVSPSDRRIKQLAPTAKGRRVRTALESRLFSGVPGLKGMPAERQSELRDALREMSDGI
ncbi:MarR family winged helix-turn-helix transcriptional regulator [Streptomyces sp. NPDC006602]|uniref:MarR family winged helix-turn-helix transcriptional regulator n=1 Tax=Streptomyces sp. NPDC006602 TaxID=3364751 RepID=UPI0036B89905